MALANRMMQGGLSSGAAKSINGDVAPALTAVGTSRTDALALKAGINVVTTAAASTGVILQACEIGDQQEILNLGANAITVYPDTGARINAMATNIGFTLATNTAVKCRRFTATRWAGFLSA